MEPSDIEEAAMQSSLIHQIVVIGQVYLYKIKIKKDCEMTLLGIHANDKKARS